MALSFKHMKLTIKRFSSTHKHTPPSPYTNFLILFSPIDTKISNISRDFRPLPARLIRRDSFYCVQWVFFITKHFQTSNRDNFACCENKTTTPNWHMKRKDRMSNVQPKISGHQPERYCGNFSLEVAYATLCAERRGITQVSIIVNSIRPVCISLKNLVFKFVSDSCFLYKFCYT